MDDKEYKLIGDNQLEDWQELILHDELNNLNEIEKSLFYDGKHYLGVSQRKWLKELLIFPTSYLKQRPDLLDMIGEVLKKDWYTDKERIHLNTLRKNYNK